LKSLYVEIEETYKDLLSRVEDIKRISWQWGADNESIKKLIEERENFRRIYDHYDSKIESLLKKRETKKEKDSKEGLAKFERVFII